ncbi:alpha-L-fucosidase [Microbacterium sulfonylureivorans]|uniref:alpha-L-fucosidase n=1 Tax=Microbacterium sulfonylureivorans TaxID=2486854 RepID=UPI000FD8667C|nr:alpha-L-fucosidase [Microbacterium sulfonylureivorans]
MTDMTWFEGAGLGLFIHWDHASQQGVEIGWPVVGSPAIPGGTEDERTMTPAQYHSSAATFDPQLWDAGAVARLARRAGAQYVVFTARHTGGYSMFHTEHSDFSIEHSPYGADITRQLVEALRAEGIRVGLYYSLADWHHPDYPAFQEGDTYRHVDYPRATPEQWMRYLAYLRGQITELLTDYGQIDLLWFDGEWERTEDEWQAGELRALISRLQPDTIVNGRLPGHGDYETPEQGLPAVPPNGPWEMCLTIGETWAYRPTDTNNKSARSLVAYLAETVALGGNMLLNIAPKGDGSLQEVQVDRLEAIGAWMDSHERAVIGASPAPPEVRFYGPATQRDNELFLHLVALPVESVVVRGVRALRVKRVTVLQTGEELGFRTMVEVHDNHLEHGDSRDILGELIIDPPAPTGALIDVIAIEFEGEHDATS